MTGKHTCVLWGVLLVLVQLSGSHAMRRRYTRDITQPCHSHPCWHGGSCNAGVDGAFTCNCVKGYTGPLCETAEELPSPDVDQDGYRCCTCWGDPHCARFDGHAHFHFHGICKYNMASASNDDFTVHAKFAERNNNPQISYARYVEATYGGTTIRLGQDRVVTVDGTEVDLPYQQDDITVAQKGKWVELWVAGKVKVKIDDRHTAKVCVSSAYDDIMTGLCGNNNDDYRDDNTCDGTTYTNDLLGSKAVGDCNEVEDPDEPCVREDPAPPCSHDAEARALTSDFCGQISDPAGPFAQCFSSVMVSESEYNASCTYDVCQTGIGHCEALEAMEDECEGKGLPVGDWRTATGCTHSLMECKLLSNSSKYDRNEAVVDIWVTDDKGIDIKKCKAVMITRRHVILTDECVHHNEDFNNIHKTKEDTSSGKITAVDNNPPPFYSQDGGGSIHTIEFPHGGGRPIQWTRAKYLAEIGHVHGPLPRINPCFDTDVACVIVNDRVQDNEVMVVPNYVCDKAGFTTAEFQHICIRSYWQVQKVDKWLGQPLLFLNSEPDRNAKTPYIYGFVLEAKAKNRYMVVELLEPVANEIGCQRNVPGFRMPDDPLPDYWYLDWNPDPQRGNCVGETWKSPPSYNESACGIHPPLCVRPVVLPDFRDPQVCLVNDQAPLCGVLCCEEDQAGCLPPERAECEDYALDVKCPWY